MNVPTTIAVYSQNGLTNAMGPPSYTTTQTSVAQRVPSAPPSASPRLDRPPSQGNNILVSQAQTNNQNIQFTTVSSIGGVVPQNTTVLQTMPVNQQLQFSQQVPIMQHAQINQGGFIQPIYPTNQQQMVLSQGGITIQHALNQTSPGKVTTANGMNAGQKMQVVHPKVVTSSPQTQFMAQQGPNGQTVMIGSLGMVQQNNIMQQATIQPQQMNNQQKNAHNQQKFLSQKNNATPIQISNIQNAQYRQINSSPQQQIIQTANGQNVLGQTHVISPLQTFNTFGPGISWTNQLQNNQIIQSPIFIRNQPDGSVYIQSAPPQQHIQQMQMPQQITTQTLSQQPVQLQSVQNVQGVVPNIVQNVPQATVVTNTIVQPQQAQAQVIQAQPSPQSTQKATGPPPLPHVPNVQAQLANMQKPRKYSLARNLNATTPNAKVTVSVPTPPPPKPAVETPPPPPVAKPPVEVGLRQNLVPDREDSRVPTPIRVITEQVPQAAPKQPDVANRREIHRKEEQVPVAAVAPLESRQPLSSDAMVVLNTEKVGHPEGSSSPTAATTFPEESNKAPNSPEGSVLTHYIEGYIIRESTTPFPVTRTSLLEELLLRDQAHQENKDRKRKHESATVNVSQAATAESTDSSVPKDEVLTSVKVERTDEKTQAPTIAMVPAAPGTPEVAPNAKIETSSQGPGGNSEKTGDAGTGQKAPETVGGNKEAESDPSSWNVEEVYEFIKSVPGCSMYADEFRSQEIDGEALLFLKVEHLMSRMNVKLGPAAKICARLNQLNSE